ncbi:hypothetical protein CDD81_2328 [Ophiocordyceps australis]|uniref:NAD-dependent epimerase/dehydratase domain-containing protein n=1 Tax=Ophiocordyceps australis TaxID=1399860 RepID=A0A2C5X7N7_9HYPO|nr:hypothetical protein CDD81_2328 [Ophiocordyceps australis]
MKVLIVGGTGMIGGHAALHLSSLGYDVTILGRKRPSLPALAKISFLQGDYTREEITKEELAGYVTIIFAAGSDLRHVPENTDQNQYFLESNGVALPRFARLARDAGVKQFIHIGSFHIHTIPHVVENNEYLKSRKLASDGVVALATPEFSACSLDAPVIVGTVSGMDVLFFSAMTKYAQGKLEIPRYAPLGGSNFMSTKSLSQAIVGAMQHRSAISGKALVFGDENLSYQEYFSMYFRALGDDRQVPALDKEHPLFPAAARIAGDEMETISYDAQTHELLGNYQQNDVYRAVQEVVSEFRWTRDMKSSS